MVTGYEVMTSYDAASFNDINVPLLLVMFHQLHVL